MKLLPVTLICRPRRFGKTLNLSMLKYFFERTTESHASLFIDKKIWKHATAQSHQGKYPLIFITLKEVKEDSFEHSYNNLTLIIAREFERHSAVLLPTLNEIHQEQYRRILNRTATRGEYSESLLFLSHLLYTTYSHKVIILMDEYDTPIHSNGITNIMLYGIGCEGKKIVVSSHQLF